MRKRPPALSRLTAMFLLLLAVSSVLLPTEAGAQEPKAVVSAATESFYYLPGETIFLQVDLGVPPDMLSEKLEVQFLLYSSAITRSYLASFREARRRYPLLTRRLATLTPETEKNTLSFQLDPGSLGLSSGVFPYEVRLVREGEVIGSDRNFLVIMKPDFGYSLNLSLLWTLDFLPTTDAQGNLLDGGLAAACSSSSSEPGFLYSLIQTLRNRPGMASSLVLPLFIYQELVNISQGAGIAEKEAEQGAKEILADLSRMVGEGRIDLLNTTYSFCDLGLFDFPGWENEVTKQMSLGLSGTGLEGAKSTGFVNPSFRLTDATLQRMLDGGMDYTVVSSDVLKYSEAGRELLEGTTITQPVRFVNSKGSLIKGFVRDESLYAYLEKTTAGEPRHLVQNIIAELAVLQREKPYAIRSCVLAFPPSFLPSRDLLETLYDALQSCPWVQVRRLEELNRDQFPLEGVAVQVPETLEPASDYPHQLAELRDEASSFSAAVVPEGHPLPKELQRLVLLAMNHRFSDDTDQNATRNYLNSLRSYIGGWISKVSIGRKRSVTLSGTEGNLSVDILSELDFPLRATLKMENPSLTFPEGDSMEIRIEPRENRFVLPITTHRRGSFLVDIVLEANGLVIDRTTITVNTSIINTLAVILLACLVGIVGLVVLLRRLLRKMRGGKHVRRKKRE